MGIIVLLAACATTRETPTTTTAAATPARPVVVDVDENVGSDVERLIIYAERLRWIAPSLLETERASAERDYKREPNPYNRMRLALLLSLRRAPFRDDVRARDLLSQTTRERGADNQAIRSFAMLWLQELDERWALERALDDERRHRQNLQKKLDQLKAIEEEMGRRAPPPPVSPRQ